MISDEPDEDADFNEDGTAPDTAADDQQPKGSGANAPATQDWPRRSANKIGLNVDAETLAWFTATHGDWQHAMRCVLRSWVTVRKPSSRASRP
jgi:uncharacterized protein (DUF4415 family)